MVRCARRETNARLSRYIESRSSRITTKRTFQNLALIFPIDRTIVKPTGHNNKRKGVSSFPQDMPASSPRAAKKLKTTNIKAKTPPNSPSMARVVKSPSSSPASGGGGKKLASTQNMTKEQKQLLRTGRYQIRSYQSKIWSDRITELMEFKLQHGHCCVPHNYTPNLVLASWVKRQRYQYTKKLRGVHTTLSDDRLQELQSLGLVFDSHTESWFEKLTELTEFYKTKGHTNVPSGYKANPSLATWVKSQRCQYRLFCQNKPSNMTQDRINQLNQLGFVWNLRNNSTTGSNSNDSKDRR